MRFAFEAAEARPRKLLTVVTKSKFYAEWYGAMGRSSIESIKGFPQREVE